MRKYSIYLLALLMLAGCGQNDQQSSTKESPSTRISESDVLVKQGVAYISQSDIANAIKSFDGAIRKNPQNIQAYIVLSETYMRLNKPERAIDTLLALLRFNPKEAEAHYLIAVAYKVNGDKEESIRHAQVSVDLFQANRDQQGFLKALSLLKSFNPEQE